MLSSILLRSVAAACRGTPIWSFQLSALARATPTGLLLAHQGSYATSTGASNVAFSQISAANPATLKPSPAPSRLGEQAPARKTAHTKPKRVAAKPKAAATSTKQQKLLKDRAAAKSKAATVQAALKAKATKLKLAAAAKSKADKAKAALKAKAAKEKLAAAAKAAKLKASKIKRAPNAYNLFVKKYSTDPAHKDVKPTDKMKACSAAFKALSPAERAMLDAESASLKASVDAKRAAAAVAKKATAKPLSGYVKFLKERFAAVNAANPNVKSSQVFGLVAQQWKALDAGQKAVYRAKA